MFRNATSEVGQCLIAAVEKCINWNYSSTLQSFHF